MNAGKLNEFEQELETYYREQDELLSTNRGDYVLIKGDEVIGVFSSEIDAVEHGYRTLGTTKFLVKKILDRDVAINFLTHKIIEV